jgi:hypothetical protein
MMKRSYIYGIAFVALLTLSACAGGGADVKEKLGLNTPPPDEFSVVTRAPLSVPPDFTLRPPRPGAERPNELTVRAQAKKTVFGENTSSAGNPTAGQSGFLAKLGTDNADPAIRESIDTEVKELDAKEQPTAEKFLFWKDKAPAGKPIDPVAEQKRLEDEKLIIKKRNEDVLKAQ